MSEVELANVVDHLTRLSEERKIIEKEEKDLKEQLKEYMNKHSLTEFLGNNNTIAKMAYETRESFDKKETIDFLLNYISNEELHNKYLKKTGYFKLTCRRI